MMLNGPKDSPNPEPNPAPPNGPAAEESLDGDFPIEGDGGTVASSGQVHVPPPPPA